MTPVSKQYIADKIYGHYPGTQYFNETLLDEMCRMMAELNVIESEFDALFQIHRSNEQKARYTPLSADLLAQLPKVRNGSLNVTGTQGTRALNDFNSMAITHGWSYAFRVSRQNPEQLQVLNELGIDEMSDPFCTLEDWRIAFVQMLHNDTDKLCFLNNVPDAYDYAAATCPDNLKEKLRANAIWFRHIGNGNARKHFPIFRPKQIEGREAIKKFAKKYLKNSKMAKFIHLDN